MVLLTLLSAFLSGGQESWHFYRGEHYDGQAADCQLADQWPAAGPPVLWVREAGTGYSSLVAWQGRVATQWQTLAGQYVVCLDADTGETVWQHRYDWPYLPGSVYPGPRATPTYCDGRLYFAGPQGQVGCLNARSGKLVWSTNLKERFDGKGTDFGCSCSPVVEDGKVIIPVGGREASLVALDAATGDVVWRAGSEPASYASALPITYRGRRLVVGYLQNALVCHDLATGELVWKRKLSQGYDEHSSWPIYQEPHLWIASAFRGGCELWELVGEETVELQPVWSNRRMSNDILSSVLHEGSLYGFDVREAQAKSHRPTRGSFRCLDFLTGNENWSVTSPIRGNESASAADAAGSGIGHASVLVADGKLVLLSDTGELMLARATPSQYEELARAAVLSGEICWTQPILYRNRLYARNQSRLVCVYLGDPELLEQSLREGAVPASALPQETYVDLATWLLGVEPEYAFDIPSSRWLILWFLAAWPGIFGTCWLTAGLAGWLLRHRPTSSWTRHLFWSLSFLVGVMGTTVLSPLCNEFIFTWEVCVFVAFHVTVHHMPAFAPGPHRRGSRWRARLLALGFLATCLAYFLICRRLSLVFEWVFLCGFAAATPASIAAAACFRRRRWYFLWDLLMLSLAFATFYWSATAVLAWKAQ